MDGIFSIFTRLADWLTYGVLRLSDGSRLGGSVHFFIEDVSKIFVMLIFLVYIIALIRATLNINAARDFLHGKNRFLGYFLAAALGALTPFCSCSSIPIFIGFTNAGIPVGIIMAFLISSPIINEVAIIIMGAELGAAFMFSYLIVGLAVGIIGGWIFDLVRSERYLIRLTSDAAVLSGCGCGDKTIAAPPPDKNQCCNAGANAVSIKSDIPCCDLPAQSDPRTGETEVNCGSKSSGGTTGAKKNTRATLSLAARHSFALAEVKTVFAKTWLWIIIGIGAGAFFHGWVPAEWVEANLGAGVWWSVPLASLLAIPLYSSATAVVPVAVSMLEKGMPLGTTLTFMLSVVGASLPGFILLKQVMKKELLISFFFFLLFLFSIVGWLFNILEPMII